MQKYFIFYNNLITKNIFVFSGVFLKKSIFLPPLKRAGAVAQLVEQRTENPCVGSSILSSTTKKIANNQ